MGLSSLSHRLSGAARLAFGVSGPLSSPLVSPFHTRRLIKNAYRSGLRIFDTAPLYGAGAGEIRLGRALAGNPDVIIMTKAGLQGSGLRRRHRDFSPEAIFASVQSSILRLDRRPIDLLWLHGPDLTEITPALIDQLESLRESGDVRHIGLAGRGAELDAALEHDVFEAVMAPVHMGLCPDNMARLARLSESSRIVFGIECLSQVRLGGTLSGRGGLWRSLKQFARPSAPAPHQPLSASEAFTWALEDGGADFIVTTTTSAKRLAANLVFANKLNRFGRSILGDP